jgi:hypothetical protein
MTRYLADDGSIREIFGKVINQYFGYIGNASVKLFFDTKKKVSKGRLVFGTCKLARDMERFLTQEEVEYGYDYFIIVDKKFWSLADEDDKIRLIRHECRHMTTNDHGDYILLPHDIEDFAAEIELNVDKPTWAIRMGAIVEAAYEQEKEASKQPRV